MSPTSPAVIHEAPATHNLTLVASGGLAPTPPTGHLTLAATHGHLTPHALCPDAPCNDPGRHHGERRKYLRDACRCPHCTKAASDYKVTRYRLVAYGRWQPYADAAPAREHCEHLAAHGLSYRVIADLAGVEPRKVWRISKGETTKTNPDTVAALLAVAVPGPDVPRTAVVDSTGARRRVQALVAVGWPYAAIGAEVGLSKQPVWDVVFDHQRITAGRAREIAEAYDRLWDADPIAAGVRPADVRMAKERAAAGGWAPPLAWNDEEIDNPQAWPDWTGICGQPGGAHAHIEAGTRPCERCLGVPFGLECGTRRGYDQHRELGTETCGPCRTAVRTAAQARKARRRARQEQAA